MSSPAIPLSLQLTGWLREPSRRVGSLWVSSHSWFLWWLWLRALDASFGGKKNIARPRLLQGKRAQGANVYPLVFLQSFGNLRIYIYIYRYTHTCCVCVSCMWYVCHMYVVCIMCYMYVMCLYYISIHTKRVTHDMAPVSAGVLKAPSWPMAAGKPAQQVRALVLPRVLPGRPPRNKSTPNRK